MCCQIPYKYCILIMRIGEIKMENKETNQETNKTSSEKKTLGVTVIAVMALIVMVVGASYAYFQAQGGSSKSTAVTVTTKTTDSLAFSMGSAINLTANQQDFANGMASKTASTTGKATLTANSSSNSATYKYNVTMAIASNNFVYSKDTSTPELLLTITGPAGAITSGITGLSYKTITDNKGTSYSGFDITNKTGTITIASNYSISSSSSTTATTQSWTFKVTFVNLSSDQQSNTGKTFSATIGMTKA